MGPKKGKDIKDDFWRTSVEEAKLNEENWQVKVIIVEAAGSDQDRLYLNKFELFAAEERRFVVKNICKTETIFMINQLGSEKKVKDNNLRIFEEGQAYLRDKKDIPPDLQALIIKHLILEMKEEYLFIKRQRLEVKEGLHQESATMIGKTEVRGTINTKPPEPEVPPVKDKKKKGEPASEIPTLNEGKKYNTSLRLRGEEWRDKVYVDDFPVDGPNIYVAVTGFSESYLPACLVRIGIPLAAVVQIRIDMSNKSVQPTLLKSTKRGQSQTEILTEKSLKFWEGLLELRINNDFTDDLKNTAFIMFSPPYWESEALSDSPDKIYDDLCFLMYDVQDLTRQHVHYLENMDIIHIPQDTTNELFKKHYYQLVEDLPLECVTTFSVLDSILQTVCKSEDLDEMNSSSSLSAALPVNRSHQNSKEGDNVAKAKTLIKNVFDTLCKTEENKKSYRITYGVEYENHKDPVVINFGDTAKYPTFHLGNINLDNIVGSTLLGMPLNRLWVNQDQPKGELEAKINFHVNVLLSCFDREDVETAELNRLIHILACRKLFNNRSSLKKRHLPPTALTEFKKVYLKRSVLAEPLVRNLSSIRSSSITSRSFPSMTKSENESAISHSDDDAEVRHIKFLFECPDISELVSATEIENNKAVNHIIDDFEFFEDFTGVCAFQVMTDAFNKFNCVDYKYCEVTDCIILMFFNSHDQDGIAREEWCCHLPTPLCLQDFFDFVLDEHYSWIQNEERIYDERMAMLRQSSCQNQIDPLAINYCVDDPEVGTDLIMEGSLKFQDMMQDEESTNNATDITTTTKKPASNNTPTLDIDSKRTKKSPATSTPRNLKQSFMAINRSSESIGIPKLPFLGYDLGDRRVEILGKDSFYFSKDGTKVSSMYTVIIPMNLEYIILNVAPGSGNNDFWIHKAIGEFIPPDVGDICESFRITCKDQVMININKQTYQVPITSDLQSFTDNLKGIVKNPPQNKSSQSIPLLPETRTFHRLYVTWPNGLITESVHLNNTSDISHIKQYHVTPIPLIEECKRCISLRGEVIIFKTSGDIEVLRPDGSYFNIVKCERRIVIAEAQEELQSSAGSDKSKKGKGKEKGKDKPGKSTSKSKIKEEDIKPDIWELFVEEFESIDTNGVKQNWINDLPYHTEKLLIRTATDYCLGEIFSRRMDGTHILLNKEGVQLVTFPNKTRIITNFVVDVEEIFPEWTEEEKEYFEMLNSDVVETETLKSKFSTSQKSYMASSSIGSQAEEEEIKLQERSDGFVSVQIIYTIEHANFTTITINKSTDKIYVISPNNTSVVIDADINYDIKLDSATSATFSGEKLHINYEACPECKSYTICDVAIKRNNDKCSLTVIPQHWMKMQDSFCKKIIVNEEGNISLLDEPCSKENLQTEEATQQPEESGNATEEKRDCKSEASDVSHGKCREMYQAKTVRFFVLRRDLTCSELVNRTLVDEYKSACRWQPWCSINQYDTFGDYRTLLSLLTPVPLTETEKWTMDSKLADKPQNLTFKDLKKESGKGYYHWMRPYERFTPQPRKPDNVFPPRLPRAFIMRTLEQQWGDENRENLKGARELLNAILRYRHIMESDSETLLHIPIIDPRTESERRTDDILQALAHNTYENLKARLADDLESRAKPDITTTPLPVKDESSVEVSAEGEIEEEDDVRALEEERQSLIEKVEEAEAISPNLARYWRRRAEEYKEEQFYKYLLREGSVPPYFNNVLGGAIWWEMNNMAGEAVTKSDRKKMKCVCADEAGTSGADDVPYM